MESEYGKCDRCGQSASVVRVYFHYPIKCECHSPNHFEIRSCCSDCLSELNDPEYTRVLFKTENLKNPLTIAINILSEELAKDKSPGSYYFSWQSNIACVIMDNSDIDHTIANEIAIKFLDNLIKKEV